MPCLQTLPEILSIRLRGCVAGRSPTSLGCSFLSVSIRSTLLLENYLDSPSVAEEGLIASPSLQMVSIPSLMPKVSNIDRRTRACSSFFFGLKLVEDNAGLGDSCFSTAGMSNETVDAIIC